MVSYAYNPSSRPIGSISGRGRNIWSSSLPIIYSEIVREKERVWGEGEA